VKNITLISDYGNASHYAAALKGNLFKTVPNIRIIDISHTIEKFNKMQSAFILNSIYKNFEEGTIHLICVDTNLFMYEQIIIAKHQNQYFIALDNGILNLMFGGQPDEIWSLNSNFCNFNDLFIENEAFVSIAKHLTANLPLSLIATNGKLNYKLNHPNLEIDENGIIALVAFIDGFGNAILNVEKTLFEKQRENRLFKIHYARKEFFDKINKHYKEVKIGEEAVLFNSSGYLEIATNEGNASQLLGLRVGSKIMIEFL
jgi:S-adenosylmethionine hydrolase